MIYTIENEYLTVGVKTDGSELTSVKSRKDGYEYLWQGDKSVWYGQSPILFPIIGRLFEDKYFADGEKYEMPKHGLYRKRESTLVERSETSLTFSQTSDDETRKKYPYEFNIFVKFSLEGNALRVTHKIENIGNGQMYFSFGAHPAFNCEIGDEIVFSKTENLQTEMIDSESYRVNETFPCVENDNKITITDHIFDNDALILSGIKSNFVTLNAHRGERKIKFDFDRSPWLGIWAKPGASYVCLEPWWGVNDKNEETDDIKHKEGIMSLQPGETREFYWKAEF